MDENELEFPAVPPPLPGENEAPAEPVIEIPQYVPPPVYRIIVKVEPYDNGAHDNAVGEFFNVPEGWIAIPEELEEKALPMLPFIVLEIVNGELIDVSPGEIPEPVEPEPPLPDFGEMAERLTGLSEKITGLKEAVEEMSEAIEAKAERIEELEKTVAELVEASRSPTDA